MYFNQQQYKSYINDRLFYNRTLYKLDVIIGKDQKVMCGSKVYVELLKGQDYSIIDQKIENKIFSVGMSNNRLLNTGIIGMKLKGERIIKEQNSHNFYKITIQDILDNKISDIKEKIRIFSHENNFEQAYMCGDTIEVLYTLYDISYNIIKKEKTSFIIGDTNIHPVLNLSVENMQKGTKRTVIFNNSVDITQLFDQKTHKDSLLIMEISC
ncbi:MAG: hypothetical protein P857_969 [Candidatus Xenolissoclinum pacificiensis L6]|uniref:Uncharacterized protein n=1 Tax=Candidatus Xenolissoclinum pacificiensis L6 TaxID=1401685 RepID=W2V2B7_9RICK|nr:MAG: hypothetical protein P857_969 [Candidatus Xenolissoclinum pacificiensis L6]